MCFRGRKGIPGGRRQSRGVSRFCCAACLAGYLKGRLNPEALPVLPVEWPQFTGASLTHRRGEQRGGSSVWICKVLLPPVSELWRPPGHPALQSARMGSGSSINANLDPSDPFLKCKEN